MRTPEDLGWTSEISSQALREGWNIWDCEGSANGRWQVCCIDSPEGDDGVLEDDYEAWRLVASGRTECQRVALAAIKHLNPNEYELIMENT